MKAALFFLFLSVMAVTALYFRGHTAQPVTQMTQVELVDAGKN